MFRLVIGKGMPILLACCFVLAILSPAAAVRAESSDLPNMPVIPIEEGFHHSYFLVPEHFQANPGTWSIQGAEGSLRGITLMGRIDSNADATEPASATVGIASEDIYYVWAHTRDFNTYTGQRKFQIGINGYTLPHTFGAHRIHGWQWELGGRVKLNEGEAVVTLYDISAYYPRVDAILLTTDPDFVPDADYNRLKDQLANPDADVPASPYDNVPDIANIPGYYASEFIVPEQFAETSGTWTVTGSSDSIRGIHLQGKQDGLPDTAQPAAATVEVDTAGIYHVWAYTKDDGSGSGRFEVAIGDDPLPETLGDHGEIGWAWEAGGRISLQQGETVITLRDISAANPRVGAVLLTADPEFVPDEDYDALKEALELSRPASEGPPPSDIVWLRASNFEELGTWSPEGYQDAFGINFIGIKTPEGDVFDPSTAEPAVARFEAPIPGIYKVWVRSRDFNVQQGARFFEVEVNGQRLNKVFGRHGVNGWAWEDGGTVELTAGTNTLKLIDTSGFWARTDGVFLTTDLNFRPPDTYEEMLDLVGDSSFIFKDRLEYPEWAKTDAEPSRMHVLENEHMRIEFYQVPTEQGDVVQKRTFIKQDGNMVPVGSRTDEFGYLLIYGNESRSMGTMQQSPIFETKVEADGREIRLFTVNVFESGLPSWMIPSSVTMSGPDTAVLAAENELARLEAEWSLPQGAEEPVVTLRLQARQPGAFSIGMFNGEERKLEEIDYLLNPFRYHGKRLPQDAVLNPEQTSSSASSSMTLSGDAGIADGMEVTFAIAPDPESVPVRWAYAENSAFGLGIMGRNRGVQPSLFAPVLGLPGSLMATGETYTFKYRPVTRLDGWFETYQYITQEIFGLADYRKNVESSLTDTILNVQDLMMDDHYGGWDPDMKGHYNMEGQNVVTLSNPLAVMQAYLLTEDEDIYEQRVVPTMAYMLTRGSQHFTSRGNTFAAPALVFPEPHPIGNPTGGFGTSVYGGMFEMTRGLSPALREIGVDSGLRTSGNAPAWSDQLWMYQLTGNAAYLDMAKEGADQYLERVVFSPPATLPDYTSFIYISYYPNLNALLDLYEATGEKRYLDGAAEAARMLLTTLRTFPVPQGDITIDADAIRERGFMRNANFWWRGETSDRLGYPEGLEDLQDMTVPAWIPSPVGLGVEQASTFMGNESAFITMSNWAADLMRLAKHTGDDTFEMAARNAVLGRGANYPGYYQNQYMMHQKSADYPYVGPDMTGIYYHHIPVYYGMLTDFLFAQAWNWSDGRIDFPYVRQQGYAYFYNRQFGSAPGTFFGEGGMWPWLKRGLVTADNIQIDWLAARKDGKFGVAFMNEDSVDITTTITFGEELGGSGLEGTAVLYDAQGRASEIMVTGGQVTLTVPARGLVALVMDHSQVKAPAYAAVDPVDAMTRPIGETVSRPVNEQDFGYGAVLQTNPAYYHAYVYVTDMADTTESVALNYRVGDGPWQRAEKQVYPYEFIIKVEEADAPFTYFFEIYGKDGTKRTSMEKRLTPYRTGTDITGFEADGQIGEAWIAPEHQTVVSVVYGTDVTRLQPLVHLSEGAILVSPSGEIDCTNPVAYTIRAENGLTATWTVFVVSIDRNDGIARFVDFMLKQGWIANHGIADSLRVQAASKQYHALIHHTESLALEGQITPEAAELLIQSARMLAGVSPKGSTNQ